MGDKGYGIDASTVTRYLAEVERRLAKEFTAQAERIMATQSVALAVQNLLLAAHDRGLGACWMCAPLFCP